MGQALLLADRHGCGGLKKSALGYCRRNHTYIMKDSDWKAMEEERPSLYEEAASEVAGEACEAHTECIKRRGKRYEIERNSSIPEVTKEEEEE